MHLDAKSNQYADAIGMKIFDACPKAVWAAIAYSLAMRLGSDNHGQAIETIKREWFILHGGNIVPQKPRGEWLK